VPGTAEPLAPPKVVTFSRSCKADASTFEEMDNDQVRTSKFLSLILRHKPEEAGLTLDDSGWCSVDELLRGCAAGGYKVSREELNTFVAENDKKRFEFSDDGTRVRASQGHSIEVNLQYMPKQPPADLYHGTAIRFLDSKKKL